MSPQAAPPKTLCGALRLFWVAPAKIGGQGMAVPFSRLRPSNFRVASRSVPMCSLRSRLTSAGGGLYPLPDHQFAPLMSRRVEAPVRLCKRFSRLLCPDGHIKHKNAVTGFLRALKSKRMSSCSQHRSPQSLAEAYRRSVATRNEQPKRGSGISTEREKKCVHTGVT
jgi:hypothetical protein